MKLSEKNEKELPPVIKECLKENGLDEETMRKVEATKDTSRIDETKCFVYCIMEKRGLLDDSKHLKQDMIREALAEMNNGEDVEKIFEKCPQIKEIMDCDTARALQKCVMM